jgi:uncharacterized protein (TIGR03067 family)
MRARTIVALLALTALTAFAPAPVPRSKRDLDRDGIDMRRFQGTWKVISMEIVQPNGGLHRLPDWGERGTTGVRVSEDRWTYLVNGRDSSSYLMNVEPGDKPAAINWYVGQQKDNPGMVGIIRRKGDRVTILYYATTPSQRPKTFDNPPNGWWILTLQRGG